MHATTEVDLVLDSLDGTYDEIEPVDALAHALQCAGLALAAGADDGLVVACLLHDLGRSPLVDDLDSAHEQVAARWLRPRFGPRVAWLAGAHVAAKRHLVATEPRYALTSESRASLAAQGGAITHPTWVTDPRWPDALQLRRWDDAAKVPGAATPSRAQVLAVVRRVAD